MSDKNFLKSGLFKLLAHLVIYTLVGLNIFYLLEIETCQSYNKSLATKNSSLERELSQLNNQEAYQNSPLFIDKEMKIRNYQNKGEQVIDLSLVEKQPENPNLNYIPAQVIKDSNFTKWQKILINGDFLSKNRC